MLKLAFFWLRHCGLLLMTDQNFPAFLDTASPGKFAFSRLCGSLPIRASSYSFFLLDIDEFLNLLTYSSFITLYVLFSLWHIRAPASSSAVLPDAPTLDCCYYQQKDMADIASIRYRIARSPPGFGPKGVLSESFQNMPRWRTPNFENPFTSL